MNLNFKKNTAFSLSEVLITLAIIGIVAAITLPSVIQNHKKRVAETKLARVYSVINNAIQMSQIENGNMDTWSRITKLDGKTGKVLANEDGISAEEWYEKYLKGYVNVQKTETLTGSLSKGFYMYFADGSALMINAASCQFYLNAADIQRYSTVKYNDDGSSYLSNTSQVGTKRFDFLLIYEKKGTKGYYTNETGMLPYMYAWDGDISTLTTHATYGCRTDAATEPAYCTEVIRHNGWKIPDDYPLKF